MRCCSDYYLLRVLYAIAQCPHALNRNSLERMQNDQMSYFDAVIVAKAHPNDPVILQTKYSHINFPNASVGRQFLQLPFELTSDAFSELAR